LKRSESILDAGIVKVNILAKLEKLELKTSAVYNKIPLLVLREGSWLEVSVKKYLQGEFNAVHLQSGKTTVEQPGTDDNN
jgi:hypothetical protein